MSSEITSFDQFELAEPLYKALKDIGYEAPSKIQAESIPHLLQGRDIIGQAQTGTGKTAAFALPLLSRVDIEEKSPQILVLTPTRELSIQVAEAFKTYARYIKDFHVTPIYGGQGFDLQLRQLKRGVHVVIGTPGRIMDHLRRGTLKLDNLKAFVLDEADEMLRMGFIDDVEWILEHTPESKQTALFSATMPPPIRKVAEKYLNDPAVVKIAAKTTTANTINQRCWIVSGNYKLDALTRIMELEPFDAVIIFVRTKTATLELTDKLEARGYACGALNGDMAQKQREFTVNQLKKGKIDVVIATDVAARGLDVERISHVVNYDIPYDTEAYVHRIGRTGRAGRNGEAILFVAPREKHLLRAIEKATGQKISLAQLPSTSEINVQRIEKFKTRITDTLTEEESDLDTYIKVVEQYLSESDADPIRVAAALAKLTHGETPLLMSEPPKPKQTDRNDRSKTKRERPERKGSGEKPDYPTEVYRVAVGRHDGVKPGNIVGAIANVADLDSQFIGHINIYDSFTTVELPAGMPEEIYQELRKTRVCQKTLDIRVFTEEERKKVPQQNRKRGDSGPPRNRNRKEGGPRRGGEKRPDRPRKPSSDLD
ncbi:MAG: DEAD/DEAH box helicase [Pseudomonadales bacterium]|nr:DEAD/DEAH box helicase [Pseudomonadales bacterium]